jgi:hypothetical protein
MRAGSTATEDPGQYAVWLEQPGHAPFLWLAGLVKQADAEHLAAQANQANRATGKQGRYVVRIAGASGAR